jgi:hypothetical protein
LNDPQGIGILSLPGEWRDIMLAKSLGIPTLDQDMFGPPKNKNGEEHRYYLLPGMGKANRRKHAQIFRWAVVAGLFISALFCLILYLLNRPPGSPNIFLP